MTTLTIILTLLFILNCIFLIAIILLQPHHSESGLAGAFGGGGGMDAFLGIKTVSVATKITVVLAVIFLLLAIVLGQLPSGSYQPGMIASEKPAPAAPAGVVTPTNTAPANPAGTPAPARVPTGTPAPVTGGRVQPAPTAPPAPVTGGHVEPTPAPTSPTGR